MENLILLDSSFKEEYVIDVFESLIWTVRYKEAGDFELYTPISDDILSKVKIGKYLLNDSFYNKSANTAHLMMIETIEIDETHVKITGRDLKAILGLRIVWGEKSFEKNTAVLTAITTLIGECITNPEITDRKISNFQFDTSSGDWGTIEDASQYTGDDLLSIISNYCTKYKFGYEVIYNFNDGKFHMKLITPVDRSYDQTNVAPVIFSAAFNNLKNSKYLESVSSYKNVALVSGEKYTDDEMNWYWQRAVFGSASGLNRREVFIDGSSLTHVINSEDSSQGAHGDEYSEETYQEFLENYGKKELAKKEYRYIQDYEGEADTANSQYIFLRDYNIGDTVEIITAWGMGSVVRVTEVVLSMSTSGYTLVPTLESVKEEEE